MPRRSALAISWINGYGAASFTIAAKSSLGDSVFKPLEFYEIPDALRYLHGRVLWTGGTLRRSRI
jgi:hypothetical protein